MEGQKLKDSLDLVNLNREYERKLLQQKDSLLQIDIARAKEINNEQTNEKIKTLSRIPGSDDHFRDSLWSIEWNTQESRPFE